MLFTPNDNATIVATFSGQTSTITEKAYAAELAEYENSRDYRELNSLMRERTAVKL